MARALSPNGRAHWATKRAHVQDAHWRVKDQVQRQGLQPMRGLVSLRARWTFPSHHRRDPDNLSTGVLKACIDALVRCGVLEDDSADHIRLEPASVTVERGRRALVLELDAAA